MEDKLALLIGSNDPDTIRETILYLKRHGFLSDSDIISLNNIINSEFADYMKENE